MSLLNSTGYNTISVPYSNNRIAQAIDYASTAHAGQYRKSKNHEPMLTHCLNVGNILAESGAGEDTVIAGILHDTIEDTFVSKANLEDNFGKNIAKYVNCVSDQDHSLSWMDSCKAYVNGLKVAPKEAQCISAADKIDNMRSMTENLKEGYNIFQNMVGTPQMHLIKFKAVFDVVEQNIPQKLKEAYQKAFDDYVATIKKCGFV